MTSFDRRLCKIQADLFAFAGKKRYDFNDFTNKFMNSETARQFDKEWSPLHGHGFTYCMEELEDTYTIAKGEILSESFYRWVGYIYRYWHFLTGESSSEIVRQAPPEVMSYCYYGFHCLDWEDAIDRLKEGSRNRNNYID